MFKICYLIRLRHRIRVEMRLPIYLYAKFYLGYIKIGSKYVFYTLLLSPLVIFDSNETTSNCIVLIPRTVKVLIISKLCFPYCLQARTFYKMKFLIAILPKSFLCWVYQRFTIEILDKTRWLGKRRQLARVHLSLFQHLKKNGVS